eukprot:6568217-Pyramimonas_sp.AAC.1
MSARAGERGRRATFSTPEGLRRGWSKTPDSMRARVGERGRRGTFSTPVVSQRGPYECQGRRSAAGAALSRRQRECAEGSSLSAASVRARVGERGRCGTFSTPEGGAQRG